MNQLNDKQHKGVRIWDLPLRLFHGGLIVSTVGLFVTAKVGGEAMTWHFYLGYFVLALLIFRFVWGFIGSKYARFTSFPPNLWAAWRMFKGDVNERLGHNPLGALSVYAVLGALTFQAISGLFSNDDIAAEGPLAIKVSKAVSDGITGLHKVNEKVIVLLLAMHLLAIAYYHFFKKKPLVRTMITGDNPQTVGEAAQDDAGIRFLGLSVFASACVIVWFLINKT